MDRFIVRSKEIRMRTFIALELPTDFAAQAAKLQGKLGSVLQANYVPEQFLHLTLAFLGELETTTQLAATQRAIELATSNFAPVSLHPEGLGFLGDASDATVWMGISPTPALMNLAKSIRSELSTKGISYDATPFKPHITLARHANVRHASLNGFAMPDTAHATNVTVFKSELSPKGASYQSLHSVTL